MRSEAAGYLKKLSPSLPARPSGRLPIAWAAQLAVVVAIGLLPTADAAASSSDRPYSHARYFVGLSGLLSVPTDGKLDPGGGVRVRGGMRVHPRFAFEGELDYNPAWDIDGGGTAWAFGFSGNGRIYLLKSRIQPFLLAGVGGMRTAQRGLGDANPEFGATVRGGIGVDLYMSTTLAASLDATYVKPFGEPDDFDYVAIGFGLQWH